MQTESPASRRMEVLSVPAEHPYTQAIRPDTVTYLPDPDIDGHWWPHPALTAKYWREMPPDALPDVLHVHFGFEHFTPAQICDMTHAVRARRVPLVVTAHDLDNPHLADQHDHHERLRLLVRAADAVVTLTSCAANKLRTSFGAGNVTVLPHPRITDTPVCARREPRAAVFVKSLRGNVVADPQFYLDIAAHVPLDVYVHDVEATEALRAALSGAQAHDTDLRLHVHAPMTDADLFAAVARATVCVLPYARGTHSGWLEMCRDHGTTVVVPDIGCYADQVDTPQAVAVYPAGDGRGAGCAARRQLATGPVAYQQDRKLQLQAVKNAHAQMYTQLAGQTGLASKGGRGQP